MQITQGKYCPLIKKDCIGLQCNWMVHVRGTHPQTGQEIDEWECSIKWLPLLMLETAKEVRQGAAATESFRNEMVRAAESTVGTLVAIANRQSNLSGQDDLIELKKVETTDAADNH
jgi:hypothetical protein